MLKVRLSENINLSHQYRMTTQIVQGDCLEHMKTIPVKEKIQKNIHLKNGKI